MNTLDLSKFEYSKINYGLRILAYLQNMLDFNDGKLYLGSFDNCREQGFVITEYKGSTITSVYFSENRNSDDIVVYADIDLPFSESIPYNHPVNWEGKYFSFDDFKSAADYIFNIIKEVKDA